MTKPRPLLIALVLCLPALLAARADTGLAQGPTEAQATTSQLVHGLLSDSRYAYRPRPLDDALSADVFERFLESLDGNKVFLTAADIEKFSAYRTRLDDAIKGGDPAPAWAMFAVYRQRVDQRTAFARKLLEGGFDLSKDERWHYDREDAAWATGSELDEIWRKSVKNDWLRLKLAGKDDAAIRQTLGKRYENLAERVGELDGDDVFQTFLNAYTAAIDPHTNYFNPRSAELFNQSMSLSLEGIGAQLQKQDDVVVVREVIAGGPAAIDGRLQPGDRIVGVGQDGSGAVEDVVGWPIDEVVDLIKGPKGTDVRLDVVPAAMALDAPPSRIELTRARIRLEEQAAKGEVLTLPVEGAESQRIGVIELPTFYQDFEGRRKNNGDYASATRDVARLLRGFKQSGVDGVVLDLRNNGGGSLNEAIELTGLFIDEGPVVQVRASGGRVNVEGDRDDGVAWDGPLAVLVNRGSASASEIFAGAIQDYGRGLVIGETTFGKGTVQNLFDLDRWPAGEDNRFGQVKFTMAQFFRVSGGSTQHKGVVPDIAFPVTVDATEFGESTYDNAIPWTRIAPVDHRRYGNFEPMLDALRSRHQARIAGDAEFKWWMEDVNRFREDQEKGWISLRLADRKAEREADDARRDARQAERKRLGLPLDPLAGDALDDGLQANERNVIEDVAREDAAEERPDPLLQASAAILADAIVLLQRDGQLASRVLPGSSMAGHWTD
jgi:carboxyl-terminal processing protease